MRFDDRGHNFGTIREADGEVSHVFVFTNVGSEPVVIDRVVASCGCVAGDYPRTPVVPGGRGEIVVVFEPAGYRGRVVKSIAVVSGGRRWSNFLEIKAKVK